MKRWLALLLLSLQVLFSSLASAAPQVPPKPTSGSIYVQDYANLLSAETKSTINAVSKDLDNKTKAQVVVVTVPSLDGQPIENYSLELFRAWGIGDKEKNNGVLLLVALKDRQSRIEVGYGLEGALPDGLTGRIQDQAMIPYFSTGNYDKGIMQGYANIASIVAKEYNVKLESKIQDAYQKNASAQTTEIPLWQKLIFIVGIAGLLLIDQLFFGGAILNFLIILFLRGGGRGGGGFGGGYGGGSGGGSGGGGGSSRRW